MIKRIRRVTRLGGSLGSWGSPATPNSKCLKSGKLNDRSESRGDEGSGDGDEEESEQIHKEDDEFNRSGVDRFDMLSWKWWSGTGERVWRAWDWFAEFSNKVSIDSKIINPRFIYPWRGHTKKWLGQGVKNIVASFRNNVWNDTESELEVSAFLLLSWSKRCEKFGVNIRLNQGKKIKFIIGM